LLYIDVPLIRQVTDTLYHVVKMISSAPTDLVISAKLAKVTINVLIAWMNIFIMLLSMVTYIHMLSCEKFYFVHLLCEMVRLLLLSTLLVSLRWALDHCLKQVLVVPVLLSMWKCFRIPKR
jgi:hypothetical protein